MKSVEFGLLGTFEVRQEGALLPLGAAKQRIVLASLALRAGQDVSTDELVEAVWGEARPGNPRRAIQLYVTRLRAVLGEAIVTRPDGYRLDVAQERIDLGRFRLGLRKADGAGDPAAEAAELVRALAQWRGEPLTGVPSELLQREVVPQLREQRQLALERRFELELRLGRHAELVGELLALTARHPLRERLWAQLMTALEGSGRRADALNAYHVVRRQLADLLGIDPGPELQARYTAVLAGGAHGVVPRQLPPSLPVFTGRAGALAELDALLARRAYRDPMGVVVISGMAGVGKTSLAVHWARRVAEEFPDGQLWASMRRPELVLTRFLRSLGVSDDDIPVDVEERTGLFRSLTDGRRMLVVLDDARGAEQVRPLLPGAPGNLVLVTSRNRLTGLLAAEGAQPIELEVLTAEQSRQLLARRLGRGRMRAAVEEIVAACAGLPLALAIAAARPDFPPRSGGIDGVRRVFAWSYEALPAGAARLFRLLGLCQAPDVAMEAIAGLAALPLSETYSLVAELRDAHLLLEPSPGRYTLHDLLRSYAAELAEDHERDSAPPRLLDHYAHSAEAAARILYPHRDPELLAPPLPGVRPRTFGDHRQALDWFAAEHPALMELTHQRGELTWILKEYLVRQGLLHEAAAILHDALQQAVRHGDRTHQVRAHSALAGVYLRLARLDIAENHCRLAIDMATRDGDEPGLAQSHWAYAMVLDARDRLPDALQHDFVALRIFEDLGDRAKQARGLNGVAWSYARLGDPVQALAFADRALDLLWELGDRLGQGVAWDTVGYIHYGQQRLDQAVAGYERALELLRELGDRYNEAEVLDHLGDAHHARGDLAAARSAWLDALEICGQLTHPAAARIRPKLKQGDGI